MDDFKPYKWQEESFTKSIKRCNSNASVEHQVIPVNASVGSGKTTLAAWTIAEFIKEHESSKTIQVFITPRIKLCKQQCDGIANDILRLGYPYEFAKFGSEKNPLSEYKIYQVDCEHTDWDRSNTFIDAKHVIFIICDASLWGTCEYDKEKRWNAWVKRFRTWTEEGFELGNVIFDEAHNFKNDDKLDKIFGTHTFNAAVPVGQSTHTCLLNFFKNVMLLSGTPAAFQKELSSHPQFRKNVCKCSVKTAIENNYVCMPRLNLVNVEMLSADRIYSNAVIAVIKHEDENVKPANGTRLLVNFEKIDEIDAFYADPYIQANIGKKFHFISIHSPKLFKENDVLSVNDSRNLVSKVDGENSTSSEVYDLLESLDSGKAIDGKIQTQEKLDKILDGKPIVVAQVAMIGEGINIKSFSSIITKSNCHTTVMQQIGRVLRKFEGKVDPNVYCVFDNVDNLKMLFTNLLIKDDLTSDCFNWGDKVVIRGGSSNADSGDDGNAVKANSPRWLPIDENFNAEIIELKTDPKLRQKLFKKSGREFAENFGFFLASHVMPYLTSLGIDLKKSLDKIKTNDIFSQSLKTKKLSKKAVERIENEIGETSGEHTKQAEQKVSDIDLLMTVIDNVKIYWLKHMEDTKLAEVFKENPELFLPICTSSKIGEALAKSGIFEKFPQVGEYIFGK